MDYALTADALLGFGRKAASSGGGLSAWASFVDRIGPSLLPFVIRPEKYGEIPLAALGYASVELAALVPQPGEVWVLFCFRDSFRSAVGEDAPLRTDGFPLVLEWRKDVADSPLLSASFHRLASLARKQLGVEGWGLCPAYARFGDKTAFTDGALFGDEEGDSSSIASAYGAVLSGLSSAVSGKHPPVWPFPTLQWDDTRLRPCGVAGLPEKLSVAADCSATVVTVAQEQKKAAQEQLANLKSSDAGGRYGKLSILAVKDVSDPKELGRRICEGPARRGRVRRMIFSAVVLFAACAAAVGLFLHDMARPVSLYFADYVDCYGLPEGIYEVPRHDVRMRSSTYRFDYQGYYWSGVHLASLPRGLFGFRRKLRRVVHVGPTDIPAEKYNEFMKQRPIIMEFDYDGADRLMKTTVRKRGGNDFVSGPVVKNIHYVNRPDKGKTIVNGFVWETFKDDISPYFLRGNVTQRTDTPGDARTLITHRNVDRDAAGRMVGVRFLSAPDMIPACDQDGVGGMAYDLTDGRDGGMAGRVKETHHLDVNGNPRPDRYGVASIKYDYSGPDLSSVEYLDGEGNLVLGRAGFFRSAMQHDGHGNCTNEVLLGKDGQPAYRVLREEDMGRELGGSQTWASCSYTFSNGLMIARSAYQPDGRLLRRKGLVATLRWEYDELGDARAIENLDADGKRMISPDGFAVARIKTDSRTGHTTAARFFMEDGVTPAYDKCGVAGIERRYDDVIGEECEIRSLDGDGNLMSCTNGWAISRCEYDRRARIVRQSFYDINTNACAVLDLGGNVGHVRWEYPVKTDDIEKCLYFTDETCTRRAQSRDGKSGFFKKIDAFGRIVDVWDVNDRDEVLHRDHDPSRVKIDYSLVTQREEIVTGHFAEKGWRIARTTWYSDDGKPVYDPAACCSKREIFDSFGNVAFLIWENEKGERVDRTDTGYSVVANRWNDKGKLASRYYYGRTGNAVHDKISGVAGYVLEYDNETLELKSIRHFDVDHRTACYVKGEKYSEIRSYTAHEGIVEHSYWHNGEQARSKGYHLERRQTDVFGNTLDEWYFDEKGTPCERVDGNGFAFHHVHAEYDAFRQLTRACRYDANDFLSQPKGEHYCIREFSYDELHRPVEMKLIRKPDDDMVKRPSYEDYPGYDANGVSRMRTTYHGLTRINARTDEFGVKDRPCLYGGTGVWQRVSLFDANGTETNICNYAIDGTFARDSDNVYMKAYSEFDDPTRHSRLDLYGRDIFGNTGVCHVVELVDSRCRPVEVRNFGKSGEPALDNDGWHLIKTSYHGDALAVAQKETFVSPTAQLGENDIYRVLTTYGRNGRKMSWRAYSKDGREIFQFTLPENGVRETTGKKGCYFVDGKALKDIGVKISPNVAKGKFSLMPGLGFEVAFLDSGGDPTVTDDGVSVLSRVYSEKPHVLLRSDEYGSDDSPCLYGATGVWHAVTLYDKSGKETNRCYFARDGRRVCNAANQHELAFAYFKDPLRSKRCDVWGHDIWGNAKVAHVVTWYDNHDNLVEQHHFDASERPVAGNTGVVRFKQEFHAGSNVRSRLDEFGMEDNPCLYGSTGVWHSVWLYDTAGRETNFCTYAVGDRSVCDTNNVHTRTLAYFEGEKRCKRRDLYGNNVWGCSGVAHVVTWYDSQSREVEEFCFDKEDRPTALLAGITGFTRRYARGKDTVLQEDRYGLPISPAVEGGTDVWHQVILYDIQGRITNTCYYSKGGRPTANVNGFVRETVSYPTNQTGVVRQLDFYGNAIWGNSGLTHVVRLFDKHGRLVEERRFAANGKPFPDQDGCVRFVREYVGRTKKIARLEEYGIDDGRGMYGLPGIVRIANSYDRDDGGLLVMAGYDKNGRKHVFRHMVFRILDVVNGGAAEKLGVKRGDVLCGLDALDLLTVSSNKEMEQLLEEREGREKRLVVARRTEKGGFVCMGFDFPARALGIGYAQGPLGDADYIELVRTAHRDQGKLP